MGRFRNAIVWTAGLAAALPFLLPAQVPPATLQQSLPPLEVPFVGCPANGQTGFVPAPQGAARRFPIPSSAAGALAYYKATHGPGVLAPRGWHCEGLFGSSAFNLFVSSRPLTRQGKFSDGWRVVGPAVQATRMNGGTMGRFAVAALIKRVFPAFRWFADELENGMRLMEEPFAPLPSGPYPHDTLVYRSDRTVEYTTPAFAEGLGTLSSLAARGGPIVGAVGVLPTQDTDAWRLALRLPPRLAHLRRFIVDIAESDASSW
jgi:hypothetical protein